MLGGEDAFPGTENKDKEEAVAFSLPPDPSASPLPPDARQVAHLWCKGGAVALLNLPPGLCTPPIDAPLPRSSENRAVQRRSLSCASSRVSLHDALTAFTPPYHQRGHQQGDEDGQQDEGAEDAVGGVVQRPAGGGAVPEVLFVHGHEELVHQPVGPVAVEPVCDERRAVRQLPIGAATQTRALRWHQGLAP